MLALGAAAGHASAVTCDSLGGSSLSTIESTGSCTIGDLTFSNFYSLFASGVVPGSGASAPSVPDPATDVALSFTEITDGSSDTFGTVGTPVRPIYQVITSYLANSTVDQYQLESSFVQFLVTDTAGFSLIEEVDDAIAGTLTPPAGITLTDKSLCAGGPFNLTNGTQPSSVCSTGAANTYEAVDEAVGGLAVTLAGVSADSSLNYVAQNHGALAGTYAGGLMEMGVYDQVDLNGGAISGGNATLLAVENDFIVGPEPRSIILLSGALIGLFALGRLKKTV